MKNECCNKKDIIFKSTVKLITQNGFDATPISMIAKDAGIAAGTIYIYFKDKHTLLNDLYLNLKEQLTGALVKGYNRSLPIRVALELIYKNYIRFMLENKEPFLFFQQFTNSPYIDKLTKEEGLRIYSPVLDVFERAKKDKVIKNIPNTVLHAQVFAPVAALIKQHFSGEFEFTPENIELTFQTCWDAIKS